MTITYAPAVLNAMLNAYQSAIGASPQLVLYTGTAPAIAAAPTGTALVTINLPSSWMGAAAGGTVGKAGTWSGQASAAGTAGYYRLLSSGGNVMEQGSITQTGSGGDLTLDNPSIANGQTVTIANWNRTEQAV